MPAPSTMPRARAIPYEQWGQIAQPFPPASWRQRLPQVVLNIDKGTHDAPRVHTLVAGIENTDATGQQYIMRWQVQFGVGGARTIVEFDATRYTRIALPFDELRVSLLCDSFVTPVDLPAVEIRAFAGVALGYAEQTLPGPVFSQRFALGGAFPASQLFDLPVGANRFRIVGLAKGVAGSPWNANFTTLVQAGAGSPRYTYVGLDAVTPGLGDLLALSNTDGWIPLASGATQLAVLQAAGASEGFVQFGLDL